MLSIILCNIAGSQMEAHRRWGYPRLLGLAIGLGLALELGLAIWLGLIVGLGLDPTRGLTDTPLGRESQGGGAYELHRVVQHEAVCMYVVHTSL